MGGTRGEFSFALEQKCLLPTDFPLTVQSKIEQSKIKAEVSGLNNPGTSAFFSGFSLTVPTCILHCLLTIQHTIIMKLNITIQPMNRR